MTGKLENFTAGIETTVDVALIHRQLRELWQQAAESDSAVTRACLFNLVVWCESDKDRDAATAVIADLTSRYPCRTIVLRVESESPAGLEAAISAHCHLAGGGRKQVCSEQISLRTGASGAGHLTPTVLTLLEADVPTVLWWRGNFLKQPKMFRRLRSVADRVVFDTSHWAEAERWLEPLAEVIAESPARHYADLSWTRLTLWRKLTADCFDDAQFLPLLPQIERLLISHGHEPGARVRALLYAGWAATQLDWSPEMAGERTEIFEGCGEDVTGVGLESVVFKAAEASARLWKDFTAHTATAVVKMPEMCSLAHTQAFAPLGDAALLASELDLAITHTTYERALSLAAILAEAVGLDGNAPGGLNTPPH